MSARLRLVTGSRPSIESLKLSIPSLLIVCQAARPDLWPQAAYRLCGAPHSGSERSTFSERYVPKVIYFEPAQQPWMRIGHIFNEKPAHCLSCTPEARKRSFNERMQYQYVLIRLYQHLAATYSTLRLCELQLDLGRRRGTLIWRK